MRINVHAGHCPDGKGASGAVGYIKESTEARVVKNKVIKLLKAKGHTVYDCTCDEKATQNGCLQKIVAKCNAHTVDLDISIHFNSGANHSKKDGVTTGTECYVLGFSGNKYKVAKQICANIEKLEYKNRGVKDGSHLYVIKNTKASAILVEVCFVDNINDTDLYRKNIDKIAEAIVNGIVSVDTTDTSTKTSNSSTKSSDTSTESFLVKVLVDDLNIRNGAGTSYSPVGQAKKNVKYTIVKTSGNWGKLKSGAGWINISEKYCKKM